VKLKLEAVSRFALELELLTWADAPALQAHGVACVSTVLRGFFQGIGFTLALVRSGAGLGRRRRQLMLQGTSTVVRYGARARQRVFSFRATVDPLDFLTFCFLFHCIYYLLCSIFFLCAVFLVVIFEALCDCGCGSSGPNKDSLIRMHLSLSI